MYLILNGDLKNFTGEEIQIIANIARYHRKSPAERNIRLMPSFRARAAGG